MRALALAALLVALGAAPSSAQTTVRPTGALVEPPSYTEPPPPARSIPPPVPQETQRGTVRLQVVPGEPNPRQPTEPPPPARYLIGTRERPHVAEEVDIFNPKIVAVGQYVRNSTGQLYKRVRDIGSTTDFEPVSDPNR